MVVAVVLLGLAGLLLAERAGVYDGPIASVVLGGGVLLIGLAIIVSGLRGRTAGGLTALAIIGMLMAGPTVAFSDTARWYGWDWDEARSSAFRDVDTVVQTRAEAEDGISSGVGDVTLDLTEVPLSGETLRVPVSGGIGDIRVIVPEDTAVVAEITSGVGSVRWDVDGREQTTDGFGNNPTFRSDAVVDGQDPALELLVQVGVGSITIEED
ncbi:hypothetical protein EBM89_11285 [Cellulomonas triticagri]|uniref:Cell wall-active antibiotics response LiaF-like C-terminal domain-containing protein n=1 Tax=Cellulomonas triticagri TaxID=2483352 RepID=A0A3M2JE62_9CELL|nr:hypothetical protein EBM89_11285 [Cellulomonas triticagri]